MDDHVKKKGMPHWSCVSSMSNCWWVRIDGHEFEIDWAVFDSYVDALKEFDKNNPITKIKYGEIK